MKTSYHRQHNHRRHFSRILLVLFVLSLLIAVLSWFGAFTEFTRILYMQAQKGIVNIEDTTQNTFTFFTNKTSLVQENQELRSTLQELKISELHSKALEQENSDLRDLFINNQEFTQDLVLARIINYSTAPYGTILITVEGNARIAVGDLAHLGKWAIGSIVEITNQVALVKLFTASDSAYDVHVGDTLGTFIGASNGVGKIMLPRTETVTIGTVVTIPSQKGLLLGSVESIEHTEEAALQTLFVRAPFNIRSLKFITIDTD